MERTYTLQDLVAALKRRRALALLVGAVVALVGVAAAFGVPSEYTAASVVQIEPRRLPVDFLPAASGAAFEERMRTIKHGILARPVLERVIRDADLYPDVRNDMDEAVSRLRRAVEVRLEGEVAGGPPALLFVVEVRGKDPQKVAKAAELLPRYYGELTRQVMQAQARSLRETLDGQTADMGKALTQQEAAILAFKVAHEGELPEMLDANARSIGRIQALVEMRQGLVAEARRRRNDVLASIPEGPSAPGMAEAGLDTASRKLLGLQSMYGDDHPDVRRAKREFEEAKARRDEELKRFRQERQQEAVGRIDAEIREHEANLADLNKELVSYQKRVDAAPRWGAELAALSREYEVLKGRYAAVVARRGEAATAESLLAADQGSMFRTVEAPVAPSRPSAPDRGRLLMLAILAAVASGLAAAGIAEWLDASVRGPEDATALGVPVLAAIPRIGPRSRTS
ncbi:MAG TPA: Wzz/FepE/Etk N-terminal domain-containing protein [Anaeromyxobacter sp.]|nr:Wzz/FepE/Etk N-terminal domain-containing protein [Anaeromyxobacter sp.]